MEEEEQGEEEEEEEEGGGVSSECCPSCCTWLAASAQSEIRATQLSLAPSLDPSLPGPSKGPDWLHCDSRLE